MTKLALQQWVMVRILARISENSQGVTVRPATGFRALLMCLDNLRQPQWFTLMIHNARAARFVESSYHQGSQAVHQDVGSLGRDAVLELGE